jgi:DNA-directed RNA polymerase specialized sigma24 family protein
MTQRRVRLETRIGHYLARQWGEVERRIAIGGKVYPDGGIVVDGWPSHSPSAQWKEGDAGSHRKPTQVFQEVHNADSIRVAQAVTAMSELQRLVMRLVYVEGHGHAKSAWIANPGIGRDAVYRILHECMSVIEAESPQEKYEKSSGKLPGEMAPFHPSC